MSRVDVRDVSRDAESYVAGEELGLELDRLVGRLETTFGIDTEAGFSLFSAEGMLEKDEDDGRHLSVSPTRASDGFTEQVLIRAIRRDGASVIEDVNIQVRRPVQNAGSASGHLDVRNPSGDFHGQQALTPLGGAFAAPIH